MTACGLNGSVRTAIVGFLSLCGISAAIATLGAAHVIAPAGAARALGIVIGAMAIVTGNFLPKTRALEIEAGAGPRTRAAERVIGWILVLAGVAFVGLFGFAPLGRAKLLAAAAGMGALLLIGAISLQLLITASIRRRAAALPHRETIERHAPSTCGLHRPMVSLLVAFLYVLATACTQYLFAGQPLGDLIASCLRVGLATGFVIYLVFRSRGTVGLR